MGRADRSPARHRPRTLDALIEWASAKKAEELLLSVTQGNAAALGLYERAGFINTGHIAELRPESTLRTISMRKTL